MARRGWGHLEASGSAGRGGGARCGATSTGDEALDEDAGRGTSDGDELDVVVFAVSTFKLAIRSYLVFARALLTYLSPLCDVQVSPGTTPRPTVRSLPRISPFPSFSSLPWLISITRTAPPPPLHPLPYLIALPHLPSVGRLRHFASITSPLTLLASSNDLKAAQQLLKEYQEGTGKGREAWGHEEEAGVWKAKQCAFPFLLSSAVPRRLRS